ncbi:uncharacterized protein LOC129327162 [Eublepharis macularius]|uniref:Uncharacterized protein LOC129327162 n=1 Tax=Eublepharis macularius TaxID=481883 RepID=A0AA97KW92_EUBMA|nr:uncharacterized protein LOC129327162 [Eublepharis macularius]
MASQRELVLLMAQLVGFMVQSTMILCQAHLRSLRWRRRAAARLFLSSEKPAVSVSCSGKRRRRRIRERWHALASMKVPRRFWAYDRSRDWWERIVLTTWDDGQWLECFRMDRETFMDLVSVLRRRLERQRTNMREPVSAEQRVAVTLWFLATGACYRVAGDQFGMGASTVATTVLEVCEAMEVELLSKTVCLGSEVGKIMDGFAALGFPHCIGAIDGTHIPISAPGSSPEQYGNRKMFSSMLLQGTVDHTGRFMDVEIGWSGKNHDAFVFKNSCICAAMDTGTFVPGNPTLNLNGVSVPPIILSDGAYPMRPWLMKPYGKLAVSRREHHFDRCLSRSRNQMEKSFGRLKGRWQCLLHRLKAREENLVTIITACVILHNICEARGQQFLGELRDPSPVMLPEEGVESLDNNQTLLEGGKLVRDALAAFMESQMRRQ